MKVKYYGKENFNNHVCFSDGNARFHCLQQRR